MRRSKKVYKKIYKYGNRTPIKNKHESWKSVIELKEKIISFFNQGKRKAETHLDFLRENQKDRPDLLAKSLSDIAERISDREIKLQLFEEAVDKNSAAVVALNSYGTALADNGEYEKSFQMFEKSLNIQPDNSVTLNRYGTALMNAGEFEKSFQMFEKSLESEPDNSVMTLNSYGIALMNAGEFEKSFQMFERSLNLRPSDSVTLTSYGTALMNAGEFEKSFQMFEKSLESEPDNSLTLNSYGTALMNAGEFEKSFQMFEKSLNIRPDDSFALNSYGTALMNAGEFEKSFQMFERSLESEPDNSVTLTSYGTALMNAGEFEKSFQMFGKSLKVRPDDSVTLTSYGTALMNAGEFEKSFQMFEKSLKIRENNHITLFSYAMALERKGRYEDAISRIEKISPDELSNNHVSFILINLGRLYYLIKAKTLGDRAFDRAIEKSDERDNTLIYAAKNILSVNPYSKEAIDKLREISKKSPIYEQARRIFSLHASPEIYYAPFCNQEENERLKDTESLNRAIYHKMLNEISIFKGILLGIDVDYPSADNGMIQETITKVDDMLEEISRKRNLEKKQIREIPRHDYRQMIEVISKTAHDIADFVNNRIFYIKSKVELFQFDLDKNSPVYQKTDQVLKQIELTESALNDLKPINEGKKINYRRFKVKDLFRVWENETRLKNALILTDIKNPDSELNSDEQKIRSFLNELIENAVNHNQDNDDLRIHIFSEDISDNKFLRSRTIPSNKSYLLIRVRDNGKGIPEDKKDWIFQPLKTTSKHGGLGLSIIRNTLYCMSGHIRETGKDGAVFEIYIPYCISETQLKGGQDVR
ncbi:ATP-binding protein [Desulfobacterales bacterium HSG2]|nr:ATP-binding protein [Desulfobacterales bacterium HSG2]